MMKLAQGFAVATAALLLTGAPSLAQEWDADATFGSQVLASGFSPDPFILNMTAGGPIDASQAVSGSCRGFIADAPDFDLHFAPGPGGLPLVVSVNSSRDTTLVINGPDGRWYCDDDSGEGENPSIVFSSPGEGLYNIWVGTYDNSTAAAELSISELHTF